jgi:hypothetical protein
MDGTLKTVRSSSNMFTVLLQQYLSTLQYDIHVKDVYKFDATQFNSENVILIHTYANNFHNLIKGQLPSSTSNIIITSFMEVAYPVDFSFVFLPQYARKDKDIIIHAPCSFKDLPIHQKTHRSILLDHDWRKPNIPELTTEIQNAVRSLTSTHIISQLTGSGATIPEYITTIAQDTYQQYVSKTNNIETFVVTHKGSYNSSIVDMLARGIRVVTPAGFTKPDLVQRFNIPEFNTTDELISLLRQPYETKVWEAKRGLCTDFPVVCQIMDNQFKRRLKCLN